MIMLSMIVGEEALQQMPPPNVPAPLPPVIMKPEMVAPPPMPLALMTEPPVPRRVVDEEPAPRSQTPGAWNVTLPVKVPGPTETTSPEAATLIAFWTVAYGWTGEPSPGVLSLPTTETWYVLLAYVAVGSNSVDRDVAITTARIAMSLAKPIERTLAVMALTPRSP